jgi:WD40 repeat protein
MTEYNDLTGISFSENGDLLCTLGKDERGREIVIIWDLTQKDKLLRPTLLAK